MSKEKAIELLKKGADVSSFGDPVEWQKKDRIERKINVTSEGVTFSKGKGKFTVKREDEGIPKVGLEAFNDLAESHEAHVHQVKKLEEDLLGIIQWVQDTCSEMDLQTKTNEEILKEYYADSRD